MSAPIKTQCNPSYPSCLTGSQVDNRFGNIFWLPHPAYWMGGLTMLEKLLVSILLHATTPVKVTHHHPWIYRINTDTRLRQLKRCASG